MRFRFLRWAVLGLLPGIWVVSAMRANGTMLSPEQQKFYAQETALERESNDFNHTNDGPTVDKLNRLVVDGVRWANIDVQSVLNDLTAQSKALDPDHAGLQFVLQLPTDMKQGDQLGRTVQRNVCIVLSEKMSLFELLDSISGQTNLSFKVEKGKVILMQWAPGNYIHLDLDL